MSRHSISGYPLGVIALGLLVLPAAAAADVLEIGESGVTWVAGGPSVPAAAISSEALEEIDSSPPPPALTDAPGTAGPAQWQARVSELAEKYDISPVLLEALVWQESRWNSRAVSPKGARGFTQLMPGTARELGVNAHDPSANLEGGARYLRAQLDAFGGDLEKALAAYNSGPHRVLRAGGIPRIRETQNYVSAILARLSAPFRR